MIERNDVFDRKLSYLMIFHFRDSDMICKQFDRRPANAVCH